MRRRNQHGPMLSTGQPLADGFSLACGSAERRTVNFAEEPWSGETLSSRGPHPTG